MSRVARILRFPPGKLLPYPKLNLVQEGCIFGLNTIYKCFRGGMALFPSGGMVRDYPGTALVDSPLAARPRRYHQIPLGTVGSLFRKIRHIVHNTERLNLTSTIQRQNQRRQPERRHQQPDHRDGLRIIPNHSVRRKKGSKPQPGLWVSPLRRGPSEGLSAALTRRHKF